MNKILGHSKADSIPDIPSDLSSDAFLKFFSEKVLAVRAATAHVARPTYTLCNTGLQLPNFSLMTVEQVS